MCVSYIDLYSCSTSQLFGLLDKKSMVVKGIKSVPSYCTVLYPFTASISPHPPPSLTHSQTSHPRPPPRDFSWCPTENNLAYWVPEINEIPAKVTVLAIPSRDELNTKSRMLVHEVWRSPFLLVLCVVYSVQW